MERLLLEEPKALIVKKPFQPAHRSVMTGGMFTLHRGQHLTVELETSSGAGVSIRDADGCRGDGTATENIFISTEEIELYCLLL